MGARYKLSQAFIKSCNPGKYNDGAGLWLHKREGGNGQWFFRYTLFGQRKETGLGGLNNVGLATARKKADHATNNLNLCFLVKLLMIITFSV